MSCGDVKKETTKIKSFEVSPLNGKDTINIIDYKGQKQGMWLKFHTNNMVSVADTMYYRNDTLIKK